MTEKRIFVIGFLYQNFGFNSNFVSKNSTFSVDKTVDNVDNL